MKKVTFRAVSPITGEVFLRSSLHAYTHAVIHHNNTERLIAQAEAEIRYFQKSALRYREIAKHLTDGTTPTEGVLLRKLGWSSGNSIAAGVRTVWDGVLFGVAGSRFAKTVIKQGCEYSLATAEVRALENLRYADEEDQYILAKEAKLAAIGSQVSEYATFHHSAELAQKAARASHCVSALVVETTVEGK